MIGWCAAMALHEIVLPETKPETEWVRGRPLQKVSPQRDHSVLQLEFGAALRCWARGRGEVGTEWRFRIAPPGEVRRPLVPDISYVSNERLRTLSDQELQVPPLAPDVAVEILSPDDRRIDVDDKISVYLRGGSSLAIVIDPANRVVELHDARGTTRLEESATIAHPAMPGFRSSVRSLFAVLRRS
ncbi:MAG: Uma2 family endonuclease [Candidatus Eremiobacteraeota bacterium]|nr:Uma2 family endonuclease [Candidatus Eremiobacteraeota bacterium]